MDFKTRKATINYNSGLTKDVYICYSLCKFEWYIDKQKDASSLLQDVKNVFIPSEYRDDINEQYEACLGFAKHYNVQVVFQANDNTYIVNSDSPSDLLVVDPDIADDTLGPYHENSSKEKIVERLELAKKELGMYEENVSNAIASVLVNDRSYYDYERYMSTSATCIAMLRYKIAYYERKLCEENQTTNDNEISW